MKTEPKVKKTKQKKERSHSIANTKKVAVAVAKNPTGTLRELAEDAQLGKSTVDRKLGQLGQVKDEWVEKVLAKDKSIVEKAQKIIEDSLDVELSIREENEKHIKNWELGKLERHTMNSLTANQLAKDSAARFTLFRWDATDEAGGLNKESLMRMTIDELLSWIKK